jgi:hypothetical protein
LLVVQDEVVELVQGANVALAGFVAILLFGLMIGIRVLMDETKKLVADLPPVFGTAGSDT